MAEPVHAEFTSCPGCRGYKKLEITCPLCKGEGSIDPRSSEARVNHVLDMINEAKKVAILPTEEFKRLRQQAAKEQFFMMKQQLSGYARNLGATQEYVGEHYINRAIGILTEYWNQENPEEGKPDA
jgi:hypothetical protein